MQAVRLKFPATMQQHSIWFGMDQRQHGEHVISASKLYGFIRCLGEEFDFTYQSTSDMAADSLTKGMGASRLPKVKDDLCLIDD